MWTGGGTPGDALDTTVLVEFRLGQGLSVAEVDSLRAALHDRGAEESSPERRGGPQRRVPLTELGRGGMGEVLRVGDLDLNRKLAMKVPRPEFEPVGSAVARFVEEAQATAQLQPPGIVPLHEVGEPWMGGPSSRRRRWRGRR